MSLRDAAHALRAAIQRHCQAGEMYRVEPELTALFLAADAPEPGQDEVRDKLGELWAMGYRYGSEHMMGMPGGPRDRLIDEVIAMMPRRDEDDLR